MTIAGFQDALNRIGEREKRLEVYTADTDVSAELDEQFTTKNVTVDHRQTAAFEDGFVTIRAADGSFLGALGLDQFEAVLSPDVHPPWTIDQDDIDPRTLFDFLENTLFTSYDRRQMLAASREIEDRAWRVGNGRLYAGFQRTAALAAQREVYESLGSRENLTVAAFVDDEWTDAIDGVAVVADDGVSDDRGEIRRFWFVAFDGGGSDHQKCLLVAQERRPDRYYGFWTYDPELVDELFDHLDANYDVPSA